MGVLGRGLASLIPRRDRENAEDVIEKIDQMGFDDQTLETESMPLQPAQPVVDEASYRRLNVLEDFEDLNKVEGMPMPEKPLVSPLPFDPFEETGAAASVAVTATNMAVGKEPLAETSIEEVPKAKKPKKKVVAKRSLKVKDEEETEESVIDEPSEEEVVVPEIKEEEPKEVLQEKEATPVSSVDEEEVMTPGFGEDGGNMWDHHEQQVVHVAIGDIKINPLQPRRTFNQEELADLMHSISQHGILQPLVVRRLPDNSGFELIAGERRLRASKKLGWDKVPAVIRRDVKSDQSRLVFALIENIQRENLSPVEEALAYQQLNEEYGLTHEEIGQRVGKSRVAITNIVRVLQLPAEIQRGLTEGKITTGHAKAILMIPNEEKQIKFYHHLVDEGLTVRKAEVRARRIQRTMNLHDNPRIRKAGKHPLALKYSPGLEQRYGYDAQVRFVEETNNFDIVFKAHSEAEVEELVGRLMGTAALADDLDKDVMDA